MFKNVAAVVTLSVVVLGFGGCWFGLSRFFPRTQAAGRAVVSPKDAEAVVPARDRATELSGQGEEEAR